MNAGIPGRVPPVIPPLPPFHASHWCEENALRLAADPSMADVAARTIVFISNGTRSVATWGQRSAPAPGEPVLWDYHVVVAGRWNGGAHVFDLDTTLGFPLPLADYLRGAFPLHGRIPRELEPRFRVIPAEQALATFASDRSHMRGPDGAFSMPPPPLPPFRTATETMNLWAFVSMDDNAGPGVVAALEELPALLG